MFANYIILLFFILLFFGLIFIGLNYYSSGNVNRIESKKKIGKKLMLFPFGVILICIFSIFIYQKISFKPNKNDIIGKYEISEASNVGIDKNEFKNYNLELKKNGEFQISNIPNLYICENGTYKFHNTENESEINFDGCNANNSANIVSSLNSFKIEFIIGDPDSGESIYFKKTEN